MKTNQPHLRSNYQLLSKTLSSKNLVFVQSMRVHGLTCSNMNSFDWKFQNLDIGKLSGFFWKDQLFVKRFAMELGNSGTICTFLDSFSQKGWFETHNAVTFRYFSDSLSEYALKKENLLINVHNHIDERTKIILIITGLPYFVREKIDPADISTVSNLLRKLNSLERPSRSIHQFSCR